MTPSGRPPYRIPIVLRDLVLVDMLELTGSTTATAALMNLSQPTVSRRYRSMALDLGLQRDSSREPGRRFADAGWMQLLRRGVNHHRLESGLLRLGGVAEVEAPLQSSGWVEWVGLPASMLRHWPTLLHLELLDGVLLPARPDQQLDQTHGSGDLVPYALGEASAALPLICRRHPLVQAIADQHGRRDP